MTLQTKQPSTKGNERSVILSTNDSFYQWMGGFDKERSRREIREGSCQISRKDNIFSKSFYRGFLCFTNRKLKGYAYFAEDIDNDCYDAELNWPGFDSEGTENLRECHQISKWKMFKSCLCHLLCPVLVSCTYERLGETSSRRVAVDHRT